MGWLHRWGERLARRESVREAIESKADLSAFRERPSARLVAGLVLLALSYLIGWPVVALAVSLAAYWKEPIIAVAGPISYGVSWVVWAISMALIGVENLRYVQVFLRWLTRVVVERMMRQG